MPSRNVSIRGLPEWLIRDYLVDLGAQPADPPEATQMRTADWAVSWSSQRVLMPGGAFSLTQFDFTFESEDVEVLACIEKEFLKKTQRGGG